MVIAPHEHVNLSLDLPCKVRIANTQLGITSIHGDALGLEFSDVGPDELDVLLGVDSDLL